MGVFELVENFYRQFEWEEREKELEGYKGIVFCGMGGSGIIGSFCSKWLDHRGVRKPTFVVKEYKLPAFVDDDYLVVCISYSGNTEETLTNFREALKRGIKPLCITSGGKLKELAQEHHCEVYEVPPGYQPRYAFGFMLSKALNILGVHREELEDARENLRENLLRIKEEGRKIAERFYNRIAVVYATPLTEHIAERWKGQINENAKSPLYYAVMPEMHHNEVMSWSNPLLREKFSYVIMYDDKDHERIKARVEITEKLLKEFGVVPLLLRAEGNSYLSRSLYLIHLADWVSLYLAQLYDHDPVPVPTIERIKHELKKYD